MIGPFNDHTKPRKRTGIRILGMRYTGNAGPWFLRQNRRKRSDKLHAVILMILTAAAFYFLIQV